MHVSIGAFSLLLFSAVLIRHDDPPRAATAVATCVRYFSLEGDVKADVLRKALTELSTADGACRLVEGPSSSAPRPKQSFIALEVRSELAAKDVVRALKKACTGVDELAWASFHGVDRPLPTILGQSARDCVIGMASDMRWFESAGDFKHFFYVPGKLDGAEIASRFQKLFGPFDAGDIGQIGSETLSFALTEPVDAAALKRASKSISKLDGVRKVDVEGAALKVEVTLEGLRASASTGRALALSGSADARAAIEALHLVTRPHFHLGPVIDVLVKENLAAAVH